MTTTTPRRAPHRWRSRERGLSPDRPAPDDSEALTLEQWLARWFTVTTGVSEATATTVAARIAARHSPDAGGAHRRTSAAWEAWMGEVAFGGPANATS